MTHRATESGQRGMNRNSLQGAVLGKCISLRCRADAAIGGDWQIY